jgi:predicted acyltransferase (DUF342 family)
MLVKIRNGLLLALISFVPTTTLLAKKKKPQPVLQPSGPISNPNQNLYRSVVTCPVCPDFTCTGITGITGITGCTGPGCTGPCTPEITAVFCCLDISESVTIRGFATVDTEVIEGNLLVGGNVDFKGDLIVQGDGNLQQNACIGRNLDIGNDLSIGGFEVILGTLTANSSVSINGDSTLNGNESLNGSLSVTSNSTIGQNLQVAGSATFAGLLIANSGPTGLTGPTFNIFNGSIINGGLIILNTGCTAPTGPVFCTGAVIGGNVCIIGDELVTGDFNVGGDLTVDKNATFNGGFTSTGTLITNNTVTMNDGLTIASGNQIINAGNLNLIDAGGLLTVGGASAGCQISQTSTTTFQGTVTANAGAIISGGLTVEEGETVPVGNFEVPQGSAIVEGKVSAGGSITSSAGQSQFGGLTITSTQNALCATGPAALVVAGGVGIAKDLWKGSCQFFANVEEEGGTPGCLDYYEETCYSTAFTWGGQPVTPATNVLVRIVRVGNLVNILIPEIIINNPGAHIDVIKSASPLPARFRPTTTIRGAASTVVTNDPATNPAVVGQLGEFDVSPSGILTIGLPGDSISPQRIFSTDYVYADINTITYNIDGCARTCKRCTG